MKIKELFKGLLGKKYTYEEILKMDQKRASELFFSKLKTDPHNLYLEMLEHEEKYHSFSYYGKANLKNPTEGEKFMLGIFTKEKSDEYLKLATNIDKKFTEEGKEEPNLIREAILSKGAQDIVNLCNK